jgi:hypothetical protein
MTAEIIPLPKRKPAFPDYAGPTERPLWPEPATDLAAMPDVELRYCIGFQKRLVDMDDERKECAEKKLQDLLVEFARRGLRGRTERPLWPGGIDDLWPSPDHWRSLDPPREPPQEPPARFYPWDAHVRDLYISDPPRDIKATGDREDEL